MHEWEKGERVVEYSIHDKMFPAYIGYLYSCKKCGKFKKIRM